MRNHHLLDQWSFLAGGLRTVDLSALKKVGPRGKPLAIEHLIVQVDYQLDTDSEAFVGVDSARLLSDIRVWDRKGDRRKLPGDKMLAWARAELGLNHPVPPGGVAISQSNATGTLFLVVPFLFERGVARDDFCMAVSDLINGGGIAFQMSAGASALGAAALTLDSATFSLWVKYREDVGDVHLRQRDEVVMQQQNSNTAWRADIGGKWLRALYAHKQAVAGGEDLSGLASVTIEQLGMYVVTRPILRESFLMERPHPYSLDADLDAREYDPVRNHKLVPIIFPSKDEQFDDYIGIDGQLAITADSSETAPDLIIHRVTVQEKSMLVDQAKMSGVAAQLSKTEADTPKTDLSKWGRQAGGIRKRVPRPRAA